MNSKVQLNSGITLEVEINDITGKIILRPHAELDYYADEKARATFSDYVLGCLEDMDIELDAFYIYLENMTELTNFGLLEDETILDIHTENFFQNYVNSTGSIITFFEEAIENSGNCLVGSDLESDSPLLEFIDWDMVLRKYAVAELNDTYNVFESAGTYFFFLK